MPLMCSWDYSKLTVEVKLEPGAAEPPTVKVKRVVHTKEVIAQGGGYCRGLGRASQNVDVCCEAP